MCRASSNAARSLNSNAARLPPHWAGDRRNIFLSWALPFPLVDMSSWSERYDRRGEPVYLVPLAHPGCARCESKEWANVPQGRRAPPQLRLVRISYRRKFPVGSRRGQQKRGEGRKLLAGVQVGLVLELCG